MYEQVADCAEFNSEIDHKTTVSWSLWILNANIIFFLSTVKLSMKLALAHNVLVDRNTLATGSLACINY